MEPKLQPIVEMIDSILEDGAVPKNIRRALSEAKARLLSKDDTTVKVSAAVYLLEPVSEDVNIPAHARTQIWGVISALESVKQ